MEAAVLALKSPPAIRRLTMLSPLSSETLDVLAEAAERARIVRYRRKLLSEGKMIGEPLIIVAGWAARTRILPDGRRQFLSFLLPGDLIGMCRQQRPLAVSSVIALKVADYDAGHL